MKTNTLMTQVLLAFLCLISACASTQERVEAAEEFNIVPGKTLIVYLSRTNNTKAAAEIIQKQVGGTLVAIELENPYPENYQATVAQVAKENETGFLPPLKTKIDSIQKYDVVFVGFPTWGMQLPPPMKSFLKKYMILQAKRLSPSIQMEAMALAAHSKPYARFVQTAKSSKVTQPGVGWKGTGSY